jgi:hypothetical protein
MYCSNCGAKIVTEGAKFCANCGFGLSELAQLKTVKSLDGDPPKAKSQPVPPPITPADSNPTAFTVPSAPASKPAPLAPKPQRKWGWGWYVLFGFIFTTTNREYEGYGYSERAGQFALLGVAVGLPVYFLLRSRSILVSKITRPISRSLVSGIIAYFIAGFVVAGAAHFVVPTAERDLDQELESFAVSVKANEAELIAAMKTFTERYIHEPTTKDEIQKNVLLIREFLPSFQSRLAAGSELLSKSEASIKNTCDACPKLEQKYSAPAKFFHDASVKTEQRAQAYSDWLTSLLNYNLALDRADGSAAAYSNAAESALAQVELRERELAMLSQQAFGQKQ